jgi:hypothetical protein
MLDVVPWVVFCILLLITECSHSFLELRVLELWTKLCSYYVSAPDPYCHLNYWVIIIITYSFFSYIFLIIFGICFSLKADSLVDCRWLPIFLPALPIPFLRMVRSREFRELFQKMRKICRAGLPAEV